MELTRHPPASCKEMFTATSPEVAERQRLLKDALEEEYKANEPAAKSK